MVLMQLFFFFDGSLIRTHQRGEAPRSSVATGGQGSSRAQTAACPDGAEGDQPGA